MADISNLTAEIIVFRRTANASFRGLLSIVLCAVLGLTTVSVGLAQQPAHAAMSNEDVIKMAKLGFGDDVIEAKIQQAPGAAFKLEVDDLSKLKAAGVSQRVIFAMLKRESAASGAASAAAVALPISPRVLGSDFGRVKLVSTGHPEIDLRSIEGSSSDTHVMFVRLRFVDYPGLKSDVRVQDPRPTFVVNSGTSPRGRIYVVSADADARNGVRSVKMGNAGLLGAKNIGAPDSSNQIEYDIASEGPTTWRLTLKKDLKPGEYGLWTTTRAMYDFGIDP